MNSRDVFEAQFKSAEMLLRVYRLLESEEGPQSSHALLGQYRDMVQCTPNEELILLLNELFVGIVRERSSMRLVDFRKDSLALLLRQAVVAACSALDVFLPHLLETYLADVVRIRQRNFLPPGDNAVRDLFRDFRLGLDEVWPLAEEQDMQSRWDLIAKRVLDHCRGKVFSNDSGVHQVVALLGMEKPWEHIAKHAGEKEATLKERLKTVVTRRNDIVHRADRTRTDPSGPITQIEFAWTQNHVQAINVIALACYDLVRTRIQDLKAEAISSLEVMA